MSDHCILDLTAPAETMGMRCTRCGGTLYLGLPVAVSTLSAVAEAFKALHAACKPGGQEP
jgi:hypothetical protein